MHSVDVSVVIPVFNSADVLSDCLDGVLAQTLSSIEVICVDDGSTDASAELLDRYAQRDDRITVVHEDNRYAGTARNVGMDRARGTYLYFLDADDMIEPTMLEHMVDRARSCDADVTICHADAFDGATDQRWSVKYWFEENLLPAQRPFSGDDAASYLFQMCMGWTWDKLFLRSFVAENNMRFQSTRTTNDAYFSFSALARARRIIDEPAVYVHHRMNQSTSLEHTRARSWEGYLQAILAIEPVLHLVNYDHFEQSFVNWILTMTVWNATTLPQVQARKAIKTTRERIEPLVDFDQRESDFFYDESTAKKYQALMTCSYPIFIKTCRIIDLQDTLDQQDTLIKETKQTVDKLTACLRDERELMKKTTADQQKRLDELQAECNSRQELIDRSAARIDALHRSHSWRIGRCVTALPRAIKRFAHKERKGLDR